jgi:hypothetical protein
METFGKAAGSHLPLFKVWVAVYTHLKVAEKTCLMVMVVMISGMEEKVEISYKLK